jgi:hypothetical protein
MNKCFPIFYVNNYSLTPNNNKGPVIGCNDNKFLNNVVPTFRDESRKLLVVFFIYKDN